MSARIGRGPQPEPPAPPPRGPRHNGAARRLTAEVPEPGGGGASPPRPMLLAAGGLAVLAIALAAGARLTGAGHIEPPAAAVDVARDLRFQDAEDGSVVVRAVGAGGAERQIAVLRTGELMFVRSTIRALARGRRMDGGAESRDVPFRLTRYRGGRLTLDDPATRQHLELAAFGPTNADAFGRLLEAARDPGSTASR